MGPIIAPWDAVLTRGEFDLALAGMVAAALALLATLVRYRFLPREAHGTFRVASLTANAVVALAFVTYLGVIAAFLLGYDEVGGVLQPNAGARFAWSLRFMDWVVTVPLLVVELIAVSALVGGVTLVRRIGMTAAAGMIALGFLGAFVVDDGRNRTAYILFGLASAVCFAVLYVLFFTVMRRSLPRLPEAARGPYRSAVVVLLLIWLVYPIVYGFSGAVSGAAVAVAGQLLLSGADMVAKIGYGTMIHRTAVLRSRNDEDLDPSPMRRPRAPLNESVYVTDRRLVDFDEE